MSRILRSPAAWLFLATVAMVLLRLGGSGFLPKRVPDTPDYQALAMASSLTEALSDYRTVGYAVFLRLTGAADGDFQALPEIHLLVFLAGVFTLWWALARFTGRPWLALAGALPLLASRSLDLLHRIQSDMLAVAFSLLTIAALLAFAAAPRSKLAAAALAIALFATYQIRPAYLFLIVLVPLAGPVLRLAKERSFDRPGLASLGRWSIVLTAVSLGPFLLFCTLRLAVVGDFGLVSFGGFNLIGLSSNLLDGKVVTELPEEHQPLAREILERRKADGLKPLKMGGLTRKWYKEYNDNVWKRAVPILEAKVGLRSANAPAINRELVEISKEILQRRPYLYAKWIVDGFVYGFAGAWDHRPTVCLGLALVLGLPLLLLPAAPREEAAWPHLAAYAFTAMLFLAGSLGLIVLVEVPFRRYVSAIGLLLPSALAMALFETLRIARLRIAALRRETFGKDTLP